MTDKDGLWFRASAARYGVEGGRLKDEEFDFLP